MYKIAPKSWRTGYALLTIVDGEDGVIVGTYSTRHYAKNRAKFFFKKEMRKAEKILLGSL